MSASSLPAPSLTPELRPYAWSTEHLLLREASASPRELSQLLTQARQRHAKYLKLVGKLVLSESIKELFGQMLDEGLLRRQPAGYVLTLKGEQRLEYLHLTQVIEPYIRQIKGSHGAAAAHQVGVELRR